MCKVISESINIKWNGSISCQCEIKFKKHQGLFQWTSRISYDLVPTGVIVHGRQPWHQGTKFLWLRIANGVVPNHVTACNKETYTLMNIKDQLWPASNWVWLQKHEILKTVQNFLIVHNKSNSTSIINIIGWLVGWHQIM